MSELKAITGRENMFGNALPAVLTDEDGDEAAWVLLIRKDDEEEDAAIRDRADKLARLFAAAPKLLTACKLTLQRQASDEAFGGATARGYMLHPDAVEALLTAVAEAEGGDK